MATNALRLTGIGNSVGIIFPKDLLAKLRLEKGDEIYITETPDGFEVSRYQAAIAEQMDAMRLVMRENREALRELAK